MPLVSIIMNCFNSSEFLKEALESVIRQTYQNWEIIFWDNQSTDNSKEIFKLYNDRRFKYYSAPEHTTLGRARNLAIEKAEGEYIAFLDCDDIWEKTKLEHQLECMRDETVGAVYSPFRILTDTNNAKINRQVNYYSRLKYKGHAAKNIYSLLLIRNFIIFSSVIIKKNIILESGGINESFVQNEDYELLLQCSLRILFACTPFCEVGYRIHNNNNSYSNDEYNFMENRIIYHSLPKSKETKKAIKRNELRYAIFNILHLGKIFTGIYLVLKNLSIQLLFELIYTRFCGIRK